MGKRKRGQQRISNDAQIAIIGGGIAGLAVALSLQQHKFTNVKVYERDSSISSRKEGYGLTLTYNEKGPLAKLGILEEVAQVDEPSRSHYIFKSNGEVLGYYGNSFFKNDLNRGKGQRGNLRVRRQLLRKILLSKLAIGTVQWSKSLKSFEEETPNGQLCLEFDDGTCVNHVDLLIAADGVHSNISSSSTVVENIRGGCPDSKEYVGIFIALGITRLNHPLLRERGFYTLDGESRLFTMPFESTDTVRRTMWQVSFPMKEYADAQKLSAGGSGAILATVKKKCQQWHNPVMQMLHESEPDSVWGTGLMDRITSEKVVPPKGLRPKVVMLGDACHAMTPFKGQGANQALTDGPLLVSWLEKSYLDAALSGFEREMLQRTRIKVKASREASGFFHSPSVLVDNHGFAGVNDKNVIKLLQALKDNNVNASLGESLDEIIGEIIQNMDFHNNDETATKRKVSEDFKEQALFYALNGDTSSLRTISVKAVGAIAEAHTADNETCLHLACVNGHVLTCRWLLNEAKLKCDLIDKNGRSPLHHAVKSGHIETIELLARTSQSYSICWGQDFEGNTPLSLAKEVKIFELLKKNRCNN